MVSAVNEALVDIIQYEKEVFERGAGIRSAEANAPKAKEDLTLVEAELHRLTEGMTPEESQKFLARQGEKSRVGQVGYTDTVRSQLEEARDREASLARRRAEAEAKRTQALEALRAHARAAAAGAAVPADEEELTPAQEAMRREAEQRAKLAMRLGYTVEGLPRVITTGKTEEGAPLTVPSDREGNVLSPEHALNMLPHETLLNLQTQFGEQGKEVAEILKRRAARADAGVVGPSTLRANFLSADEALRNVHAENPAADIARLQQQVVFESRKESAEIEKLRAAREETHAAQGARETLYEQLRGANPEALAEARRALAGAPVEGVRGSEILASFLPPAVRGPGGPGGGGGGGGMEPPKPPAGHEFWSGGIVPVWIKGADAVFLDALAALRGVPGGRGGVLDVSGVKEAGAHLKDLNADPVTREFLALAAAMAKVNEEARKLPKNLQPYLDKEAYAAKRHADLEYRKAVTNHEEKKRAEREARQAKEREGRTDTARETTSYNTDERIRERYVSSGIREAAESRLAAVRGVGGGRPSGPGAAMNERLRRLRRLRELQERQARNLAEKEAADKARELLYGPSWSAAEKLAAGGTGALDELQKAHPSRGSLSARFKTFQAALGFPDVKMNPAAEQAREAMEKSLRGFSAGQYQMEKLYAQHGSAMAHGGNKEALLAGQAMFRKATELDAFNALALKSGRYLATNDPHRFGGLAPHLDELDTAGTRIHQLETLRYHALTAASEQAAAAEIYHGNPDKGVMGAADRAAQVKAVYGDMHKETRAAHARTQQAEAEVERLRTELATKQAGQDRSAVTRAQDELTAAKNEAGKATDAEAQKRADRKVKVKEAELEAAKAKLDADLSPHQAAVATAERVRDRTRTEAEAQAKATRIVGREHKAQQDTAQQAAESLTNTTANLRTAQGAMHAGGFAGIGDVQGALEGEREKQSKIVNTIKNKTAAITEASKALKGETNWVDLLHNKIRSLAFYFTGGMFVYGLAAGIKGMIGELINLETVMHEIQGIFANKTLSERLQIEQGVIKAAKDYGTNLMDVAHIAKTFAQTGEGPEATMRDTRAALLGVRGAGLDPNQAVEMSIAVRNLTGGKVSGADIVDRISRVEAMHAVTAQDLSNAIQRVGALAFQLQPQQLGGVDQFDLLSGMTTKIVEATRVTGAQAATSLRFMMARLASPAVARNLQNRFGLPLAGNNPDEMRPLQDILTDLSRIYKGLVARGDTIKANQLLVQFAGARQVNAAAALLDNWNDAMKIATESAYAFGDAQRRLAINMDTVSAQMASTKNAFIEFFNSLANKTGAFGFAKGALKTIRGGLESASDNPTGALGGAALYGGIGATLLTLFGNAGKYTTGLKLRGVGAAASEALLAEQAGGAGGAVSFLKLAGSRISNSAVGNFWRAGNILATIVQVMGRWLGPLAIISGLVWALAKAMEYFSRGKVAAQKERDQFGTSEMDLKQIMDSDEFKGYREKAEEYGKGSTLGLSGDLYKAVLIAKDQVLHNPKYAKAGFTESLFASGNSRTTNPAFFDAFNEELLKAARPLLPGLEKLGDESEQLAEVMSLLKSTVITTNAAMAYEMSHFSDQTTQHTQRYLDRVREAATRAVPTDVSKIPVQPSFLGSKFLGRGIVNAANRTAAFLPFVHTNPFPELGPDRYSLDKVGTEEGPSLEYNRAIAEKLHGKGSFDAGQVTDDLTKIMGMLTDQLVPNLNGALYELATRMFVNEKGARSYGQILDQVTRELYELTPAEEDRMNTLRAQVSETRDARGQRIFKTPEAINDEANARLGFSGMDADIRGRNQRTAAFDESLRLNMFRRFGIDRRLASVSERQQLINGGGEPGGFEHFQFFAKHEREQAEKLLAQMEAQGDPQAKVIKTFLDALGDTDNRARQLANLANAAKGRGIVRDRLLEILLRFNEAQTETLESYKLFAQAGVGGINVAAELKQAAFTALRSMAGVKEQIHNDLIRSVNQMTGAIMEESPDDLLAPEEGERPGKRIMGRALEYLNRPVLSEESKAGQMLSERTKETLRGQFYQYQAAFKEASGNDNVFKNLPTKTQEFLKQVLRVRDVLNMPAKGFELVMAGITQAFVDVAAATAKWEDQQLRVLQTMELEAQHAALLRDLSRERAEFAAEIAQRDAAFYGGRGADTALRAQEEMNKAVRQESEIRGRLADKVAHLQAEAAAGRDKLDVQREIERAQGEAGTEIEGARARAQLARDKVLEEARSQLRESQRGDFTDFAGRALGGFRDLLAGGYEKMREVQKESGNSIAKVIFESMGNAIRERLAQNLMDALVGPYGVFTDRLSQIFAKSVAQQYDVALQENNLREASATTIIANEQLAIIEAHTRGADIIAAKVAAALGSYNKFVPADTHAYDETVGISPLLQGNKPASQPPAVDLPTGMMMGGGAGLVVKPGVDLSGHDLSTVSEALAAAGITMSVNSGNRTAAEQQKLREGYRAGLPGIFKPAEGTSQHELGNAIDFGIDKLPADQQATAKSLLEYYGWTQPDPNDPVHFIRGHGPGATTQTLRGRAVTGGAGALFDDAVVQTLSGRVPEQYETRTLRGRAVTGGTGTLFDDSVVRTLSGRVPGQYETRTLGGRAITGEIDTALDASVLNNIPFTLSGRVPEQYQTQTLRGRAVTGGMGTQLFDERGRRFLPSGNIVRYAEPGVPALIPNVETSMVDPNKTLGVEMEQAVKKTAKKRADQQKKFQRDQALQALAAYAGQFGGTLLGNAISKHKDHNYADTGASFGTMVGSYLGGPIGGIAGGLLGGMLGGLIHKKEQKTIEYAQAERIERNTREAVTAIENQTRQLMTLDNRSLYVPASFVMPQYLPGQFGGGGGNNNVTIHVNQPGATAEEIARHVDRVINQSSRTGGTYTPFRY
jgi:hypothetical protein